MTTSPARRPVSEPRFLDFNGRRLFVLQILPTGPCTGALLYLPPFAEEMNRCRSEVVAQARELAALGWRCLLLDPFGTGESEGSLAEANWSHWLADAAAAGQWLVQQSGQALTVWGIRTGALLAADLATSGQVDIARLLFWQPVLDGQQFMGQYLRLRIASQLVSGSERETTETIRARLSAGEIIEVAGYPLAGAMANSIAERRMSDATLLARQQILWIEVVAKAGQAMALPSRRLIDSVQAAGGRVSGATTVGPMLWQLHERAEAPELRAETLRLMGEPL